MRISTVTLAVVMAAAACGQARGNRQAQIPTLEPRSERSIRVYNHETPRCGFREVGSVSGDTYRDLQAAAFRLRANAVILSAAGYNAMPLTGMAVQFTRADCQQ